MIERSDEGLICLIPTWIAEHPDLTPTDRSVWIAIDFMTFEHGSEPFTHHEIGDYAGMSYRTVYRSMDRLVAAGALRRNPQPRHGNTYSLADDKRRIPA